jgi:hypothetical protein
MKVVNGFTCRTNCDVTLAKKGVDPAHPHDPPGTKHGVSATSAVKAAPESESESMAQAPGENAPADSGTVGTMLSTYL